LEEANTHITATSSAHTASAISIDATGDISATNVQVAIEELASEKAALDGATFTGTPTATQGTNTTQLATMAAIINALSDYTTTASLGSMITVASLGSIKFGNGLLVQGGAITSNAVTFPVTFTSTVFTVVGSTLSTSTDGSANNVSAITLTGCTYKVLGSTGRFIAIGV